MNHKKKRAGKEQLDACKNMAALINIQISKYRDK